MLEYNKGVLIFNDMSHFLLGFKTFIWPVFTFLCRNSFKKHLLLTYYLKTTPQNIWPNCPSLSTWSVSTALRILSQDLSWTICSHLWMDDLNQLWKPVKANILASLYEENTDHRWIQGWRQSLTRGLFKRRTAGSEPFARCYAWIQSLGEREKNQLEWEELPEAFEDFQGHEELKDGLSHCLSQSGALLLQGPTHPLHCYVHIVSCLEGERNATAIEHSVKS